jgi:hypothetical protein
MAGEDVPFHFSCDVNWRTTERAAPCYGEDNDYVYDELLKLTKQERSELEKEGVI